MEGPAPLPPGTFDLLRQAGTATLATQLFQRGLRNVFLYGLRPLNPDACGFVAEAFTLRYIPAREDLDHIGVFQDYEHPQRCAVESVPKGQALVMDCRGQGRAASAGEILVARLMRRGAAGIVTDGSLRDSPDIARRPFPAFTAGVSAATNLVEHHAVEMQTPVGCAGVPVYPGDVLCADAEGIVCVPRHLAAEIAEPAAAQERQERFILAKIEEGRPLRGTYPPDERTRAEYAEHIERSERAEHRP